ncbi:MAG: acetate kinase [Thermodesulfobacteriota bacterium]
MRVIVVNCGSSSIKYETFDVNGLIPVTAGLLENIGGPDSRLKHRYRTADGAWHEQVEKRPVADHREGFACILDVSGRARADSAQMNIFGVGHRVVHGGEKFTRPVIIDESSLDTLRALVPLAPLHNPANITGITVMREMLPEVLQVAVFDTAFHQTMPPEAFLYALPYEYYQDHGVRRYGFHGSSHRYVAGEAARHLNAPPGKLNLITLHLGNGASAAAIERGKCVDTSMGLTPLEGLVMGTRCGDLDPAIPFFLAGKTGRPVEEMEAVLNRESGLKGLCGVNDMREIQRRAGEGNARARLALDMFCYRVKKYIGAYYAALGTVDAIVFTGGIGENSAAVREKSCRGLSALGIMVDPGRNNRVAGPVTEIQDDRGRVKVLVIPTNEELEIARQTIATIKAGRNPEA